MGNECKSCTYQDKDISINIDIRRKKNPKVFQESNQSKLEEQRRPSVIKHYCNNFKLNLSDDSEEGVSNNKMIKNNEIFILENNEYIISELKDISSYDGFEEYINDSFHNIYNNGLIKEFDSIENSFLLKRYYLEEKLSKGLVDELISEYNDYNKRLFSFNDIIDINKSKKLKLAALKITFKIFINENNNNLDNSNNDNLEQLIPSKFSFSEKTINNNTLINDKQNMTLYYYGLYYTSNKGDDNYIAKDQRNVNDFKLHLLIGTQISEYSKFTGIFNVQNLKSKGRIVIANKISYSNSTMNSITHIKQNQSNIIKFQAKKDIKIKTTEIYEGTFHSGLPDGYGIYFGENNFNYSGEFNKGKQCGFGCEYHNNGSIYKGFFKNDSKTGKGLLILNDNSYYGIFNNNILNKLAKIYFIDGGIYEGEVYNFKMSGIGCFTWSDNRKYIGEYRNNRRNGFGIMLLPGGFKYEGYWVDGLQNGYGIESISCFENNECNLEDNENNNNNKDFKENGNNNLIKKDSFYINNSSILKEFRYNKVLRILYNITDLIGDNEFIPVVHEIREKALNIFEKYQKVSENVSQLEKEIIDNINKQDQNCYN